MFRSVLIASFIVATFAAEEPITCAEFKALPACTEALVDADTDCYGTLEEDYTTAEGDDTGSTCMTINMKEGDDLGDGEPLNEFSATMGSCSDPASCTTMKGLMPTVDITCAADATSCAVGNTCVTALTCNTYQVMI
jgi:hypothetical protein